MEVLLVAVCVAVLAWTCAKEKIFLEVREYLTTITKDQSKHWLIRKICYMPTCEYCCSFWITLLAVIVFQSKLYFDDWRGYIVFHLVAWAIAIGCMSIFQRIRVDIRKEQADADAQEKENG